jgi:PmbA protein
VDEQALLELCDVLVDRARRSGADEAEAIASWNKRVETALENDDVHTVHVSEETTFGLRVIAGGSLGFVTANRLDAESLGACVDEAIAQARVMPADPFNGLPAPVAASEIPGLWDDAAAALTVEATAERAVELARHVKAVDSRVRVDSGSVGAGAHRGALVSSAGTRISERSTSVDAHLFGMAVDGEEVASFDYDGESVRAFAGFDARLSELGDRFARKCLFGLGAERSRSFKGLILLSPEAVAEFMLPSLTSVLAADAVRKGRSPLADKLGATIAVEEFSLIDDPTRAGGVGSTATDREGVPTRRFPIVEHGVLRSFLFNHYEAKARGDGARSTGHAAGSASSLPAIGAVQLEVPAGDVPLAKLRDGGGVPIVYVGRFSGSTNAITGDFSGVVKNGALLEGGRETAIKETTIAGNLYELLTRIVGVSSERRTIGGVTTTPSILVDGISVTAG